MATITVDTFLDGGTAVVAGEQWTMNGATFTIRTDTRWHANAPASMTGSLGTLSISAGLGGSIYFNGKNVRWMPFNTGSGNVPAIGTTITQGGVSGYLLGVWADYTSAPTAVGAAMPATGFLKFREVTGGTYSTGTLTGIGASATSADVVGWIEIVNDASTSFGLNPMGNGLKVEGDWFQLGTTNGSRGQTFNVPTNGGGAATHVIAIQIETAPGSNVYDWYHGTTVAQAWTTANIALDARGKFFESVGNGVVRIGSDGTNSIGFLPVSGCKVRMPNIIARTVATGTRAVNAAPGTVTRPGVTWTGGGKLDLNNLQAEWALGSPTNLATKFDIKNSALEMQINFTNSQTIANIDNIALGGYSNLGATYMLQISGNSNIFNFTNSSVAGVQSATNGLINIATSSKLNIDNVIIQVYKFRTSAGWHGLHADRVSDSTFNNIKLRGTNSRLANCTNVLATNFDYIDNIGGNTNATQGLNAIKIEFSSNTTFDGLTLGMNGTFDHCNPYTMLLYSNANINNVKFRNVGTRSAPLSSGTNATFYPQYVVQQAGIDFGTKFQRVYCTNTRTSIFVAVGATVKKTLFESVYGTMSQSSALAQTEATFKGVGFTSSNTPANGFPGMHCWDEFNSDTTGKVVFTGNSPTPDSSGQVQLTLTPNLGSGFVGDGALSMDTIGDECIIETPYYIKGHTSFQNIAPNILGSNSGNYDYTYKVDLGSGYGATWKDLTAANLNTETISAAGFKMKLRIVTRVVTASSRIEFVKISTNSTLAAQVANLYDLDTVTQSFTGLIPGSEVRCYAGTDPATAVEIGGIESTAGSTFSFTHSSAGVAGTIAIFALGYQPIYLPFTYTSVDNSVLIQPVIDRNYVNPV